MYVINRGSYSAETAARFSSTSEELSSWGFLVKIGGDLPKTVSSVT